MPETVKNAPHTRTARIVEYLAGDPKLHLEPVKLITHPIFSPHYGTVNQYAILIAAPVPGTMNTDDMAAVLKKVAISFLPDEVIVPYLNEYTSKMHIGRLRFDEPAGEGTAEKITTFRLRVSDPLLRHEVATTQNTDIKIDGTVTCELRSEADIKLRRTTFLYLYPSAEEAKRAWSVDLPYVPAVLHMPHLLRKEADATPVPGSAPAVPGN